MADPHPNAVVARKLWDAVSEGNAGNLEEILAPKVVWRSPGEHPLAGEFRGARAVAEHLARIGEVVDEFRSDLKDILASDRGAALHYHVSACIGVHRLEVDALLLFRVQAGRVTEATVLSADPPATERFWSRLPLAGERVAPSSDAPEGSR